MRAREISECANLLTIVWYVLAVRQDCRRRGWKSTSDPPRKRLTPIPVLIAQTCFPSPLRLRVHTTSGRGRGVERGLRRERLEGGWRSDEGMRLFSGLIGGRGGWGNAKRSVLQRHKRDTRNACFANSKNTFLVDKNILSLQSRG